MIDQREQFRERVEELDARFVRCLNGIKSNGTGWHSWKNLCATVPCVKAIPNRRTLMVRSSGHQSAALDLPRLYDAGCRLPSAVLLANPGCRLADPSVSQMPVCAIAALHDPRRTNVVDLRPRRQPLGKRITDAAAQRIHQVFFRMPIGRKIKPLAPPALTGVVSKRMLQVKACAGGSSNRRSPAGSRSYQARPEPGAGAIGR